MYFSTFIFNIKYDILYIIFYFVLFLLATNLKTLKKDIMISNNDFADKINIIQTGHTLQILGKNVVNLCFIEIHGV